MHAHTHTHIHTHTHTRARTHTHIMCIGLRSVIPPAHHKELPPLPPEPGQNDAAVAGIQDCESHHNHPCTHNHTNTSIL